jgi:hypothetical protein
MKKILVAFALAQALGTSASAQESNFWGMVEDTGYCMAFWSGYVFNSESGECEARSASGCTNPFLFETQEDCEAMARGM